MASDLAHLPRPSGAQRPGRPPRAASHPRHFRALDGIRAVAVIAVLLYHFDVPHMSGGFLGVDLFFVLSGYLITSQLITRWVRGGPITGHSFAEFWAARARRLFPPLVALLVGTSAVVAVADRVQLSVFRGDVAAAATYSSNWWYIFHQRSYFVAAGRSPMLQHLWSLAVEEQFYLVWPVVILLVTLVVRARWARRGALLVVAVGLMLISSLTMGLGSAIAQVPELGDPSRWYFGTDSHAMGLLAGAALATARGGDGLGGRSASPMPVASRRSTLVGVAALAAILAVLSQTGEFSTWLYRYGFLAFSLLGMALIAVAVQRGPVERLLGTPLLVAIGRRSYSMYLWHWPIACMTRPGLDLAWPAWQVFCLRVALTLALTEASYRLIETPIRRHGWRVVWRRLTAWRLGSFNGPTMIGATIFAVVVAICLPSSAQPRHQESFEAGAVYVQCTVDAKGHPRLPGDAPAGARCAAASPAAPPQPAPTATGRASKAEHSPAPSPQTSSAPTTTHQVVPSEPGGSDRLKSLHLAIYGDSVPLGALPELTGMFASVTNHAVEGAQAWDVLPDVVKDARAGTLDGDVVLIHTGDNGLVSASELASALDALHGARTVIVATPHTPRQWEQPNVKTIRQVVAGRDHVVLFDWNDDVVDRSSWLWKDGIHLTPDGGRAYARLVAQEAVQR